MPMHEKVIVEKDFTINNIQHTYHYDNSETPSILNGAVIIAKAK